MQGYSMANAAKFLAVACLAFVDDTTWVSDSRDHMQEILDIATSFFKMHGIENDVNTICGVLRRKAVTDRQVVYIVNNVLLPRIAYKISIQVLSKTWLGKLTGRYMKLCKSKCKLPSTTPNSIQHHHRLGAIRSLVDVQAEEQISSLHNRLNDDGLIGRLTRERLIALQASLGMTESPVEHPALVKKNKHSLTSSICEIMAERSVAFSVDLSTDLNVPQGSMTVAEWGGRWLSEDTLKTLSTPSWYLELTDAANREDEWGETWCTDWIARRRTQIQTAIADLERPLVPPEILTEEESEDDEQTESE
ncbi:hypothetical protein BGZ75_001847, partial [Mortierella antarctica]